MPPLELMFDVSVRKQTGSDNASLTGGDLGFQLVCKAQWTSWEPSCLVHRFEIYTCSVAQLPNLLDGSETTVAMKTVAMTVCESVAVQRPNGHTRACAGW